MEQDTIHEAVRNRYGAIARSVDTETKAANCCGTNAQSTDCCGSSAQGESGCGCNSNLYSNSMLEGLPVDVTGLSLGCGGTQFNRSNTACCAA